MKNNHKSKILIFSFISITIFLIGCTSIAVSGSDNHPPEKNVKDNYPPKTNVKPLSSATEKELTFSNEPIRIVFAIDASGKIQGFRTKNDRSFSITKPFHAGNIQEIEMITLIKTSNPKWCFRTTSGDEECITWDDPVQVQ